MGRIRNVTLSDSKAIADIYNYYIAETIISFETEVLSVSEMSDRITQISSRFPYFVYEEEGEVIGYCYITKWKDRCAYHLSVESTIYLRHDSMGSGIGSRLYEVLIEEVRRRGFHAVIAGITIPNQASIGLHEKFGFKSIARFKEVGYKFDQWLDVGYWELII